MNSLAAALPRSIGVKQWTLLCPETGCSGNLNSAAGFARE